MNGGRKGIIFRLWRHAVFKESAISLVLKLLAAALSFVASMMFARGLGVEAFGHFSAILAYTAVLAVLGGFGLNVLSVREVAACNARREWSLLRGFLQFTTRWSVLGTVLAGACYALWAARLVEPAYVSAYLYAAPLILLIALNNRRAAILRGLNHVVLGNLADQTVRYIFVLLALVALPFFATLSLSNAVLIHIGGAVVSLVVGGMLLLSRLPPEIRGMRGSEAQADTWKREMTPFYVIALLQILNTQFMTILMASLASPADTALYAVALRATELVSMGLLAVNAVVQPKLVGALAANDRPLVQRLANQSAKVAMLAGGGACAFLLLAGPLVLSVFGPEFESAYPALAVLTVGQVFSALTGSCGAVASMAGMQRAVMRALAFAVASSSVIAVLLVPVLGALGGAIATASGVILVNLITVRVVWKQLAIYTPAFGYRLVQRRANGR